jgi:hypothetical protein
MANRLAQEPAYPQTQAELEAYCERLIEALRMQARRFEDSPERHTMTKEELL